MGFPENTPLRVAVIGAGGIAQNIHLPALSQMEDVSLCAVCDLVASRASQAAERFSIGAAYTDYRALLQENALDAVYVLVQPDQTFRIVLDCLSAGVDTFLEKPAGLTSFQADTLAAAAQKHNRIAQVGFNRRFIPLVRVVLEKMRAVTEITHVEGCFFKNGDPSFYDGCGSAFFCDTIHVTDLLRWIAGGKAVQAATLTERPTPGPDCAWDSIICFDNGVIGTLRANYHAGGRVHTFELHGPFASAYLNLGFGMEACEATILYAGGKCESLSARGSVLPQSETLDGVALAGGPEYFRYYGYWDESRVFLDAVRTRRTPEASIEDAAESMRLAEYLLAHEIS